MRIQFVILSMLFSFPVYAQKVKTVEGEYTYYAPENVTLEQAKNSALERAKIQALADAFGTIVQESTSSRVTNQNGKSSINFSSIGGTEVKGEWIETTGEPIFDIRYEGNMLVVSVRVKGKAREILSTGIDFTARVLKNGIEDKFESDQFKSGDDLYLSFQSPANGYLAVYLVDAEDQAFCLLPYRDQQAGIYPIKANKRYLFFNIREAPKEEQLYVDEYTMTCERSSEHNQIYVIFSPNQFTKAVDNDVEGILPRHLSFEEFNKWLVKCRRYDVKMTIKMIPITINHE